MDKIKIILEMRLGIIQHHAKFQYSWSNANLDKN